LKIKPDRHIEQSLQRFLAFRGNQEYQVFKFASGAPAMAVSAQKALLRASAIRRRAGDWRDGHLRVRGAAEKAIP
jgi:hypothetical protein